MDYIKINFLNHLISYNIFGTKSVHFSIQSFRCTFPSFVQKANLYHQRILMNFYHLQLKILLYFLLILVKIIEYKRDYQFLEFIVQIKMKFINNDPKSMKKIAKRLALLLKLRRLTNTKSKEDKKSSFNVESLKKKHSLSFSQIENSSLEVQVDPNQKYFENISDNREESKVQQSEIQKKSKKEMKEIKEVSEMQSQEEIKSDQSQGQEELLPLDHNPMNQEKPAWYFSDKLFSEVQLSEPTMKALEKNNYKYLTHIQSRSINYLLKGRDVLGAAKTGSGKTLAYLLPCIELLRRFEFKQQNGTGVIVITPTRQLAIQVYDVAKKMLQFHNKTVGLLIGGNKRKPQSIKLQKGINLLICTPGRLLDHLHNSKFIYHNLLSLVIDEADAILRIGFEQQLMQIIKVLPKQRQTVLFSATQTRKIDDLAKLSLKQPLYIGVDDINQNATVQNLEQGFVVINAADKFRLLLTFLRKQKQKNKKVMVFFSSCNSVKFYSDLLNYIDINVMEIHGKQKQQKRSTTFYEFNMLKEGILLCTDVAARGLDIPQVDWIIQYDPPLDIKQYIHRVGRTCRGHNAKGKALLLLLQQQKQYLKHLLQAKVQLNEYQFAEDSLEKVQEDFQLLMQKNTYLKNEATAAYKSYLHAYTTYSIKEVFNVHSLDLKKIAKSFGLVKPPFVQLNLKLGGSKNRKLKIQNKQY